MIGELKNIEKTQLLSLLQDEAKWHTLDVNYHPPRVERLWTQMGKNRLLLHVIHPCTSEEALYHPHPWPSAIHILSGEYEMGLGVKASNFIGPTEKFAGKNPKIYEIAKVILGAGSYYEMLQKRGWHFVRPISIPCVSLMLIGEPWDNEEENGQPNPEGGLFEILSERKQEILTTAIKLITCIH